MRLGSSLIRSLPLPRGCARPRGLYFPMRFCIVRTKPDLRCGFPWGLDVFSCRFPVNRFRRVSAVLPSVRARNSARMNSLMSRGIRNSFHAKMRFWPRMHIASAFSMAVCLIVRLLSENAANGAFRSTCKRAPARPACFWHAAQRAFRNGSALSGLSRMSRFTKWAILVFHAMKGGFSGGSSVLLRRARSFSKSKSFFSGRGRCFEGGSRYAGRSALRREGMRRGLSLRRSSRSYDFRHACFCGIRPQKRSACRCGGFREARPGG